MKQLFDFISALEATPSLTEAILDGYSAIFEGYDLGSYRGDERTALDKKQEFAASANPAMAMLLHSQRQLAGRYAVEDETELDNNGTSLYSVPTERYEEYVQRGGIVPKEVVGTYGDVVGEGFGLTAGDLHNRMNRNVTKTAVKNDENTIDKSSFAKGL